MSKSSKEFQRRLKREIKLFIVETMDGCVECLTLNPNGGRGGGCCDEHQKLISDLVLNPRKYIKIKE